MLAHGRCFTHILMSMKPSPHIIAYRCLIHRACRAEAVLLSVRCAAEVLDPYFVAFAACLGAGVLGRGGLEMR